MPPSELNHEQIVARLETHLDGISAIAEPSKYWFTYGGKVTRVDELHVKHLRPVDDINILILEGDEFLGEAPTKAFENDMEVWLLAGKKLPPTTKSNPWDQVAPKPSTLRNRLVQDVRTRIAADMSLGDAALGGNLGIINTQIKDINRDIRIEQGVWWAAVEMRLLITYTHMANQP